jgi:hypothetical protein
MTTSPLDPYAVLKATARTLEELGVPADEIIDALIRLAIDSAVLVHDREVVSASLKDIAAFVADPMGVRTPMAH